MLCPFLALIEVIRNFKTTTSITYTRRNEKQVSITSTNQDSSSVRMDECIINCDCIKEDCMLWNNEMKLCGLAPCGIVMMPINNPIAIPSILR